MANVRWIPNHHIKPLRDTKHPLRIKEIRSHILIIRIPVGDFFSRLTRKAVMFEQFTDVSAELRRLAFSIFDF